MDRTGRTLSSTSGVGMHEGSGDVRVGGTVVGKGEGDDGKERGGNFS